MKFWHIDYYKVKERLPKEFTYFQNLIFLNLEPESEKIMKSYSFLYNISPEDITYLALLGITLKEETNKLNLIKFTDAYYKKLNSFPIRYKLLEKNHGQT